MSTEHKAAPASSAKNLDRGTASPGFERGEKRNKAPTIQIVLRKAPSPPRNQRSQSHPEHERPKTSIAGKTVDTSGNTAPAESVELITALSNPLIYQRPALLPPLQKIIQSLEVAHSTVEAYAAGDYMTSKPINVALGRVLRAWTEFISPLNAIHGLKGMNRSGPGSEERTIARQAVGRKLLALAKDKQTCVLAMKKLQRGHEDGSDEAVALANKEFDCSLVKIIHFATMMATIEHALHIATERVAVKMIADGQELFRLKKRSEH